MGRCSPFAVSGSYVHDENQPDRDIDVLGMSEAPLGLLSHVESDPEVSGRFASSVDLVPENILDLLLWGRVQHESEPISSSP